MLKTYPIETVVAHVHAGKEPHIEIESAPALRIPIGTPLVLKATYRILDERDVEEDTEVRFESDVAGAGPEPATLRRHDRPLLNDEAWGFLSQVHRFQEQGEHAIRFRLTVRQTRHAWAASDESTDVLKSQGVLTVQVV